MGNWAFYEDESTWSSSVSQMCSTIVNFGVELPWCVCQTSSNVLQQGIELATSASASAMAVTGMDAWWTMEHSLFLFQLVFTFWTGVKQRSERYALASRTMLALAFLALIFALTEMISGLQGGVVFGGKLFHPTIAALALIFQVCSNLVHLVQREIFGFGPVKNDSRPEYVLAMFERAVSVESIVFLAIATFGMPKIEQDTALLPWMTTLPIFAFFSLINEYLAKEEKDRAEEEELEKKKKMALPAAAAAAVATATVTAPASANGDIKKPEAEKKKKEAAPASAATPATAKKDEEKKNDSDKPTAAAATPAEDAPLKPKVSIAYTARKAVCAAACRLAPVYNLFSMAYAKINGLPWAYMADMLTNIGTLAVYGLAYHALTDDVAVGMAMPALTCALPMAIRRLGGERLGEKRTQIAVDGCRFATSFVTYYVYKANIVQAY